MIREAAVEAAGARLRRRAFARRARAVGEDGVALHMSTVVLPCAVVWSLCPCLSRLRVRERVTASAKVQLQSCTTVKSLLAPQVKKALGLALNFFFFLGPVAIRTGVR